VSKYNSAVLAALPLAAAEWEVQRAAGSLPSIVRELRATQTAPPGDWRTWLILAGRGWGKTLTGASDLAAYALGHPGSRLAVVAPTYGDARDTCVEGDSGLLSVLGRSNVLTWNRSLGELVLTNAARFKLFSADEPERLRGPQHHRAWADELGAWKYPQTWDMLMFGLRLGADPRAIVTTTPRPTPIVKMLADSTTTMVTRGSSYENLENLPAAYRDQILGRYEGTRLGRQEIHGEILLDVPGALWTWAMLGDRRPAPDLTRVVVAIDPAVTSGEDADETGIVVAGLGVDGAAMSWPTDRVVSHLMDGLDALLLLLTILLSRPHRRRGQQRRRPRRADHPDRATQHLLPQGPRKPREADQSPACRRALRAGQGLARRVLPRA
jgi:phage terminase large subunit-like protein